jgi:DNA-binding beta-propeller fold protein YncE
LTILATGFSGPITLAFAPNGTLYEAAFLSNTVNKINTTSGAVTPFVTTGLNGPAELVFDATGILYEADYLSGKINKISSTGVVTSFVTGLSGPSGLAFAPSASTAVPEPFTIIGTLIGGTAAIRMRKKLKSTSV